MEFVPTRLTAGRTLAYRGTVTSKKDRDLLSLRTQVAEHNASIRHWARVMGKTGKNTLLRVSLMARGTRRDRQGVLYHHNADTSLQHDFAERFDVYVHDDSSGMYDLERELETGMTSGELRKYDNLMYKVRQLEWAGRQRKQEREH
jgi:hypothetical protein